MEYKIKNIDFNMIDEAFELTKDVFMEFDAPDYSKEGIEEVMNDMLENKDFKHLFKTGEQIMIGAVIDNKIIGVLGIGINNHISLLFVDKEYHRKGVAKSLVNEIIDRLRSEKAERITLNSTPYAVPFYNSVGFVCNGEYSIKHGVKYTPMEFIL